MALDASGQLSLSAGNPALGISDINAAMGAQQGMVARAQQMSLDQASALRQDQRLQMDQVTQNQRTSLDALLNPMRVQSEQLKTNALQQAADEYQNNAPAVQAYAQEIGALTPAERIGPAGDTIFQKYLGKMKGSSGYDSLLQAQRATLGTTAAQLDLYTQNQSVQAKLRREMGFADRQDANAYSPEGAAAARGAIAADPSLDPRAAVGYGERIAGDTNASTGAGRANIAANAQRLNKIQQSAPAMAAYNKHLTENPGDQLGALGAGESTLNSVGVLSEYDNKSDAGEFLRLKAANPALDYLSYLQAVQRPTDPDSQMSVAAVRKSRTKADRDEVVAALGAAGQDPATFTDRLNDPANFQEDGHLKTEVKASILAAAKNQESEADQEKEMEKIRERNKGKFAAAGLTDRDMIRLVKDASDLVRKANVGVPYKDLQAQIQQEINSRLSQVASRTNPAGGLPVAGATPSAVAPASQFR